MQTLNLVLDYGSSSIKTICAADGGEPIAIAMEPEIIEISQDEYLGLAEGDTAVGINGKYFAVDKLARNYGATANLGNLKSDGITVRTLGAISWVHHRLEGQLGRKFKLDLSCLLPPGEMADSRAIQENLHNTLLDFDTPKGKLKVKLSGWECQPEGSGFGRYFQAHQKYDGKIGVVVLGHRNLSAFAIEGGRLRKFRSSDFGFNYLIQGVLDKTAGYKEQKLIPAIGKYLNSTTAYDRQPDQKLLKSILLRQNDSDREAELEKLVLAIEKAKNNYWRIVSNWLDTEIKDSGLVTVGGGTSWMFRNEIGAYINTLPAIEHKLDLRQYLNGGWQYASDSFVPPELRTRFCDVSCLWHFQTNLSATN
jgi:hypothetical protein